MDTELTADQRASDELGYYEDTDIEALLNTTELLACAGIGPVQVCVTQISTEEIQFEVKLAGQRIGGGRLNRNNAAACVGANIGLVKARVCVTADFNGREVWAEGEVCVRKIPSGWSCRGFRTKLLSW